MVHSLIRPGNSPKSRPTLIPPSPATCLQKRPNGRHAPCAWRPCASCAPISLDACLRVPTTSRAGARASLLPPSLPLPVPRLALALSRGKRSRHGRRREAQATAAVPAAPSHRGRSRVRHHLRLASPSPSRALVAAEFHRRAAAAGAVTLTP